MFEELTLKPMSNGSFEPTEEQRKIVESALPPLQTLEEEFKSGDEKHADGRIVMVVAAAGAGKTSTTKLVIDRLAQLGHKRINYAVFNKANAVEAERSICDSIYRKYESRVKCKTLNAFALQALNEKCQQEINPGHRVTIDDNIITKIIEDHMSYEIDCFLGRYRRVREKGRWRSKAHFNFVVKIISKMLNHFLYSDAGDGIRPCQSLSCNVCNGKDKRETCVNDGFKVMREAKWIRGRPPFFYYPAHLWHKGQLSWGPKPAPTDISPEKAREFYTDCASFVWARKFLCWESYGDIQSHDTISKVVQIEQMPMPYNATALIVDEAQDCSECQIAWCFAEARRGVQVYMVGDYVQMIYGFRGAKSSSLRNPEVRFFDQVVPEKVTEAQMELWKPVLKFKLTRSFRFEQNIAAMANTLICSKYHSKQKECFDFYQVKGHHEGTRREIDAQDDIVTSTNLLRTKQYRNLTNGVTVLARMNATIVHEAIRLLHEDAEVKIFVARRSVCFSRIAKNAKLFYEVKAGLRSTMPKKDFPKKWHEDVTWAKILADKDNKKYSATICIVDNCESNEGDRVPYENSKLKERIDLFETRVLNLDIKPEEAHVRFSTIHAAKGLEWHNVQILDDVMDIHRKWEITDKYDSSSRFRHASEWEERPKRLVFDFKTGSMEDDVNCLYVAVTRARKVLAIPPRLLSLVTIFRQLKSEGLLQSQLFGDSRGQISRLPVLSTMPSVKSEEDEPSETSQREESHGEDYYNVRRSPHVKKRRIETPRDAVSFTEAGSPFLNVDMILRDFNVRRSPPMKKRRIETPRDAASVKTEAGGPFLNVDMILRATM